MILVRSALSALGMSLLLLGMEKVGKSNRRAMCAGLAVAVLQPVLARYLLWHGGR